MDEAASTTGQRNRAGQILSAAILVCTAVAGLVAVRQLTQNPRTDDAEVFANFIGMAPLVNGPVTHLYVQDNQLVKAGQPLFDIDDRPYSYALANAKSNLTALQGEISDEKRIIAGKVSGVDVARAGAQSAQASQLRSAAAIQQATADVENAKAAVQRADAELAYATNNLHRIEPLLAKQYVTVDQVDEQRTLVKTREQAASQARAQLALAQAGLTASHAQYDAASAATIESNQQVQQAAHNVTTLEPLEGQIEGKQAAINNAQYDYDNCHVVAPFDARVTNLTISEGAYAKAGTQVFTLIDTRVWWVVANFRETQLRHIQKGMTAEVYVLSRPNVRFKGVVDSVGYGVTPDADLVGKLSPAGLPDVQRTLNWVHLASRFPVRVRIEAGPNDLFRLGESAVVVIRGDQGEEHAELAGGR
ncbi:efflux RND transporter periplasmic adaptor subunit [Silvibacterium dinghuense]|uniref:Biotin/lipoyl-binding protein n=1 Tax=Silvibacterium dinghuense TaxID=1560006 RepID=A0A4Q1SH04_9BACT|nr:efflux RND transporter periplasmic adaptor subunit [Silvibacterium dinghuense]RXS96806.1 biotin/lipoyl-binding protein [Silvibacterium dinghuense]GGG93801.1 multidrug transporter subunit MdtN [Silvibacterium dinghuense]